MIETEKMTGRQIRSMAFLMTMGGIFVIGGTKDAGEESYLAALLSAAVIFPLYALYEYLLANAGAGGLFALCRQCLGPVFGRVSIALLGLYALIIGSALFGNYLNFIYTVFLTDTALLTVGVATAAAVALAARCGRMALARTARIIQYVVLGILSVTLFLSLFVIDLENFPLPVMAKGFPPIASGAFSLTMIPFGDAIILLPLLDGGTGRRGSRNLMRGAGITWALLSVIFLRNVLALGASSYGILFFKSFVAVRIISVGAFFQRIEILVSVVYILCDAFKLVVCTRCVMKCLDELTGMPSREEGAVFSAPAVFLMLGLAAAFIENQWHITRFLQVSKYVAVPFAIVLPGILALCCWMQTIRNRGRLPTGCISSSAQAHGQGNRRW